jgi:hypothetical protein
VVIGAGVNTRVRHLIASGGVFGSITFDPATRRVKNPSQIELLVKGDAFTLWDGTPVRAS